MKKKVYYGLAAFGWLCFTVAATVAGTYHGGWHQAVFNALMMIGLGALFPLVGYGISKLDL